MLKFVIILTAASSLSSATTFYVSLKGHDSYPGTALKPWAMLQHAVDAIQHGDTILEQAGTYAGCRIQMPGVQNSPKVLMGARAHVVLNRPGAHNKHNSIIE